MEDLFAGSVAARKTTKLRQRAAERSSAEADAFGQDFHDPEFEGDYLHEAVAPRDESDAEAEVEGGETAVPPLGPDVMVPGEAAMQDSAPELGEEKTRLAEQRREVAQLESMIEDAQNAYEQTVRGHLQKMQRDQIDAESKEMPKLYAAVRRWQDQLEPVLKQQSGRPEFDVYNYSQKILSRMTGMGCRDDPDKV